MLRPASTPRRGDTWSSGEFDAVTGKPIGRFVFCCDWIEINEWSVETECHCGRSFDRGGGQIPL